MEKQKEAKKKYVMLQQMNEHGKQIHKQLQQLEQHTMEIMSAAQSIDELKQTKAGTEILVPITNGVFATAMLQQPGHFIVNVGSNTAVRKGIEDTKAMLLTQLDEMKSIRQNLNAELIKITMHAQAIEKELKSIVADAAL